MMGFGKWDDGFALKITMARNLEMENFLLNPTFQHSMIPTTNFVDWRYINNIFSIGCRNFEKFN